ncbi:MAG: QcrA and Rieske domain-containing protein [Candidatus Kapaibacteriales bacterium]
MDLIISRRIFLKKINELVSSIGVSIIYLPILSCEKDFPISPFRQNIQVTIDLTNEKSDILNLPVLTFIGQGITKQFQNANFGIPVIIVRFKKEDRDDDFLVYSGLCTHDHCFGKDKVRAPIKIETVSNKKICRVVCNCHGSEFDLLNHGIPIKGPAEKPLKFFKSSFNPTTNELTIYF